MFRKMEPWFMNKSYNRTNIPYDYLSIMHGQFDWFALGDSRLQPGAYSAFDSGVIGKRVSDFAYYDTFATLRTRDYR